ncbi:MAG TPA: (Fe-S)-binding protein [Anaerolineales bacterium]|nr:(Fe-S)-binding protein [Anaerolineales bacterium]
MPEIVQLFATCLVDSLFPEVGEATMEVVESAGYTVSFAADQTCCGQPAFNAGYWEEARRMAQHTIDVMSGTIGPIVIPSGSCTAMIRHSYKELFGDDPIWLPRARELAARIYELSEFLVDVAGVVDPGGSFHGMLAYHPSCHLARGLGVQKQPLALLRAVPGAQVTPLEQECCGFGGIFAVDHPEISAEMLERRLCAIEECGAEAVVGADVSCLMHMEGALRKSGSPVRCAHLAQVLAGRGIGLR